MKCSLVARRNGTLKDRKDAILLSSSGTIHQSGVCKWIAILLFNSFLSLLTATPLRAQQSPTPPDPALVVRKSGPATMNLGRWGTFAIDVQNTGQGDAWNVSLRDLLPNGAPGGMCN